MNTSFKNLKTLSVIGLLLICGFVSFTLFTPEKVVKADPIITYNSVLRIEYPEEKLDDPIQVDETFSVPFTVYYSTNLPEWATGAGKFILFGQFMLFPPQIHLEVETSSFEEWASIGFDSKDLLPSDIPTQGMDPVPVTANLQISPYREAPSEPQFVNINFSVEGIKFIKGDRLKGFSQTIRIPFTPAYVPQIDVFVDKPMRVAGPREPVSFNIRVKNVGNKQTIVKVKPVNVPQSWAPVINPPQITINPDEEETMTFSVVPPYSFGWHNEMQSMQLDFEPYPSPPSSGREYNLSMGQVVTTSVRINNYGFSIPGFEFVAVIAALGIALVIFKKKYKK